MNSPRKSAAIVGALFIFAIVTLFVGQALYNPIISSTDYLETVYPNKTIITAGIVIEFLGIVGLAFIPTLLFPYLKDHNQTLARGYISIRLFEVVLLSIAQLCKLILIDLSRVYLNANGADSSFFINTGELIKSLLFWNDSGGFVYLIVFVIGMVVIYSAFYQSKLIPRWLSIWGLAAAAAMLLSAIIGTFEILPVTYAVILMLPVPLQEITMSIWLIAKGYNHKALSTKT